MADFSAKEQKNLINEHSQMLDFLKGLDKARAMTESALASKLQAMASRDAFAPVVHPELCEGRSPSALPWELSELLKTLYQYRVQASQAAAAVRLLQSVLPRLEQELNAARAGSGMLRRLFSSVQQKTQATAAVQYLAGLKGSAYWQSAQQLRAQSASMPKQPDQAAVWQDISQNRTVYREICERITKGVTRQTADVAAVISQLVQLQSRMNDAQSSVEQSKSAIQRAAEQMRGAQAQVILSDVPVEELNRGRGGIRVKTLRDSGYNTVEDVLRASEQELIDLKGISPEGAREIKTIAAEFARSSASTSRIRLSADDRTPRATALVQAICDYRAKRAGIAKYEELHRDCSDDIFDAVSALERVGNGAGWLFYSESEKEEARLGYHYLTSLLGGEYAATAAQTYALLTGAAGSTPQQAWDDFSSNTIEYLNILESVMPDALGNDDSVYGLPEELALKISEQETHLDGLDCTLRPYQTWGLKYILHQKRVLLGDEMGLGKTVQAIASMVSLANTGQTHFLVVCPASVISNWCREIEKFCALAVTKIHGASKLAAVSQWQRDGGVGVTTYETTGAFDLGDDFRFGMLTVDEAHYIKNPDAIRSVNVRKLCDHAERVLFMTGTALENKVEEMLSLVRVLRPTVADEVKSMAFMASAPQFREKIAPVYYRRKRADVLKELPELTDSCEWCAMQPAEEKAYEAAVMSKNYAAARRVSWNVDDIAQSSKANRLREIAQEAESEGRKLIVFSFFLDTIQKVLALFGEKCAGPINGSVPPRRRQEIIDAFDKAAPGTILAAQIQSGGTGLNIQSASVVVLCEPQFKPSIENQAISRAYRMGQARNVLVYRLLCENSVDEKITEMLEQKQAVFDAFADDSAVAQESMELDEKGFGEIMQEEYRRIAEKQAGETSPNSETAEESPNDPVDAPPTTE